MSPLRTNRKYLKKQLRNQRFSVLPTFVPLNKYQTYSINQSTDTHLLHDLIRLAQHTTYFTIDTESDIYTFKPSLIQIEFIHQDLSTILIFEMCHMPNRKEEEESLVFWLIRSLFRSIFRSTSIIHSWGDAVSELAPFIIYGLFTMDSVQQPTIIDVQNEFNQWYSGKVYGFQKLQKNWSLQAAIANIYNQFLDKSETLNVWSRGLYCRNTGVSSVKLASMINYVINDCLAVTKLAFSIGQDLGYM